MGVIGHKAKPLSRICIYIYRALTDAKQECLESLNLTETKSRVKNVRKAHEKTFQWVFEPETVSFTSWLQEGGNPIYWIQGKPGSGKSTLMKFVMQDERLHTYLGCQPWSIVAFFFHDRGSEIQKSLSGMLREILHSILSQNPTVIDYVVPSYLDLVHAQKTRRPDWTFESLREALSAITKQRKCPLRLCIFLDALDEHNGDNDSLARILKDSCENADNETVRLKLCLASRSWTVFQQHFSKCSGLAIHEHTFEDVKVYTRTRLEFGAKQSPSSLTPVQIEVLCQQITQKALGVFIWVRLVIDLLEKGVRDGTLFSVLQDQISKMPRELKDLYTSTIQRLEPEYIEEAYVMFENSLYALEPLSLDTFMQSTTYNINEAKGRNNNKIKIVTEEHPISQLRRLTSRTGGLLEAVPNESQNASEGKQLVDYHHWSKSC